MSRSTGAADVTSRIKLGTYVLNTGVRDPLAIASDAATFDLLSHGRLLLGLGAGHTPAEWSMIGRAYPEPSERVRRLAESVATVTALLAGEVVNHAGRSVALDDAFLLSPRPQQARIPILVGGNGREVVRLAGQAADVVSLTGLGRTLDDGHRHEIDWSVEAIDEHVVHQRATRGGIATRHL